ncbi:MAG TPA: hypothetical protein VMG41_04050 [Gemmatimonadales bacterium]|nr:hypothetical protein [Gemmatimonadales bacterium]
MTVPEQIRSEPDVSGSLSAFKERLAETVAWCHRRTGSADLAVELRSPSLAPPPATPWLETMHAVAEARSLQLGRSWRRSADLLGGGLLLLYFPRDPHSDGAARAASSGYLDARDTPPWDTWVAYVEEVARGYLVAWVPPDALGAVTAALRESEPSVKWLVGSGVALEESLKTGDPMA